MSPLVYSLISTILVSAVSCVGAVTMFLTAQRAKSILYIMVAFAAGALIGAAFFHLLPEALEKLTPFVVFTAVLIGFSLFFLLERLVMWHHCHDDICEVHPFTYLTLTGDAIHNFVDGIIIAASFLIHIEVGIMTTIAIIMHEIPQELGDFGILVYGGMKPKRALFLNFLVSLTAICGTLIGYFLFNSLKEIIVYILPFAAGNFIYIASSDLIPELHKEPKVSKALLAFLVFAIGAVLMGSLKMIFA